MSREVKITTLKTIKNKTETERVMSLNKKLKIDRISERFGHFILSFFQTRNLGLFGHPLNQFWSRR